MPTLTEEAEHILANAKLLDAYTASQNLPPTSFEKETLFDLPPEIELVRKNLVDGSQRVKKLAAGSVSGIFETLWGAINHAIEATDKYGAEATTEGDIDSIEQPNKTGYQIVNGTEKKLYDFLEQNPERARRFGGAMTFLTSGRGFDIKLLLGGYPGWARLHTEAVEKKRSVQVVDVGGGHGGVSIALVKAFSTFELIVQDLPDVVKEGRKLLTDENSKDSKIWKKRVSFMEHDFFKEQPIKGADVYFARWILHNWSDAYCIRILRNLVPALESGKSRVVLYEHVLPEIAEDSWVEKAYARTAQNTAILPEEGSADDGLCPTYSTFSSIVEHADDTSMFFGL
ncbi:hypothetical protein P7C71_g5537, partial [Lecanoromycetidae sp. Uapishka_2]